VEARRHDPQDYSSQYNPEDRAQGAVNLIYYCAGISLENKNYVIKYITYYKWKCFVTSMCRYNGNLILHRIFLFFLFFLYFL
jgi:hypothetical protein